jgi:TrkA-C domain
LFQVVSLLIILAVVLIVGRLATIALTATGVPREIAKFQARSALTGAGFTTTESESIVNHPVRRRIVMFLMLTGSLGGGAAIATLIGSFVNIGSIGDGFRRAVTLLGGLVIGLVVMRTPAFDRLVSRVFAGVVQRIAQVDLRDYAGMLRLSGDYGVNELFVEEDDWLADKTLAELDLSHEGILVLGIVRRDGSYLGAPKGSTRARQGDTLILYGRGPLLAELDDRRSGYAGERAHAAAVVEQRRIEQEQVADNDEEAA